MIQKLSKFYIGGKWVTAHGQTVTEVVNPASLEVCATVANATRADVDAAFEAAKHAFDTWSQTSATQRKTFMLAAADAMERRKDDFVDAHVSTLGVPRTQAVEMQIDGPIEAMRYFAGLCDRVDEVEESEGMLITREPVGVCALINPWNYPLLQMIGKVGPALAAGCTMVEKPSEETPTVDFIMAEIFDEIGLPGGVFNLISGIGSEIGPLMSAHPLADMVSFTGSTRSGISVAEQAAPSVKRVCQELGGKSAFIIVEGANLEEAVEYGVNNVFLNAGQTCDALTRMLIPDSCYTQVVEIAQRVGLAHIAGDPESASTTVGPLVAMRQKELIDKYLAIGIEEGAQVLVGGVGYPQGVNTGAFVKPTIFANVTPDMRIAREEIFGPVLCIMKYESIEQAIEIANSSEFGLSSAVWAKDKVAATKIAKRMRAGQCFIQGGYFRVDAPFGGFKQSGNGREWGHAGMDEYLEIKAIIA